MQQTKAELKISQARTKLILEQPFFGTLALRLKVEKMPAGFPCQTMATDGRSLLYADEYVEKLSLEELVFEVAHEVMHLALSHHARRGVREPELWNTAADRALDPLVRGAGFRWSAEVEAMNQDPRFNDGKKPAEVIYGILKNERQSGSGGQGSQGSQSGTGQAAPSNGATGEAPPRSYFIDPQGTDGKPASAAELAAESQRWQVAVLQAAQAARQAGNMPGNLASLVKTIRRPEVDWREALRRYVTAARKDDYSWRRPNARHLASDLYLPSLHSESVGTLLVAFDTSGSTSSPAERGAYLAELNGILAESKPERTIAVYWDTRVCGSEEFSPDGLPIVERTMPGGGGTLLAPVWDWVREHDIEPVCAIVLTDMGIYGGGWGDEPPFPVLFVATDEGEAPYGEIVRLRVWEDGAA